MAITPEVQALIDAEVKGLKEKNDELLAKLTSQKTILDKVSGVDLDKLVKDSETLAELLKKGDEEKGEYKKLYEGLQTTYQTETTALKGEVEKVKGEMSTLTKRNELAKALGNKKVDPLMLDMAISAILPKTAIDDKGVVMIDGKTPEAFTTDWVGTDLGKRFVISGNSGGGADGDGDAGGSGGFAKFFDPKSKQYSITEQAKIAKTNLPEYTRLKAIYKK